MNEEDGAPTLTTARLTLNEAYLSALAAGFTAEQAMQIVLVMVSENLRGQR